jgi:predicted TIM-barrel fold metal-dependent hydrolase
LLHCYPYEREAGYLAQAFNNVYLDGGLAVNYLGARTPAFIARLLELAPFRKILYSSDGFGPAELHYLGAALWRNGIHRVLNDFVQNGDWCESDAMRVVDLIAYDNSTRVYNLRRR